MGARNEGLFLLERQIPVRIVGLPLQHFQCTYLRRLLRFLSRGISVKNMLGKFSCLSFVGGAPRFAPAHRNHPWWLTQAVLLQLGRAFFSLHSRTSITFHNFMLFHRECWGYDRKYCTGFLGWRVSSFLLLRPCSKQRLCRAIHALRHYGKIYDTVSNIYAEGNASTSLLCHRFIL